MEEYILISTLNDFIFCPYSIYLHNVYMEVDEGLYHASPQTRGKEAHSSIDNKSYSSRRDDILSMPVYCDELGIMGKIDLYRQDKKQLVERKYSLKQIYKGQIYQLWGLYFCLVEMGYEVDFLTFYEISTNKSTPIPIPDQSDKNELKQFIDNFKLYDPSNPVDLNINKCRNCIYCSLCDKTDLKNV